MKKVKMFQTQEQADNHIETLSGKGQAWTATFCTAWYRMANESKYKVQFPNESGWYIFDCWGQSVITE